MPYIRQEDRDAIDTQQLEREGATAQGAGVLNYILTTVAVAYFKNHGGNYCAINDVIGALEGAKLEFYRRVAAPYEDGKIRENGDVY